MDFNGKYYFYNVIIRLYCENFFYREFGGVVN